LIQQIGVNRLVHFTLQDLFGTLDGQRSDFTAQRFARLDDLLIGIGLRLSDDAGRFGMRLRLDFVGDRHGALLGFSDALLAFVASLRSSSPTRLCAASSSALPFSAADRPSAIFFARSSSALTNGGHTNFIVNHARIRNTTICANRVALRFTVFP
jgi:hypothetical protein